ncbi:nucleoporin NUP2 [Geosmithia morbida]|uniref:Nucleoporin NUP2 n=1 Tax=Geosmithia morbida TaxID=1094350 RepID=A0A9P4Z1F9_9HYPO|nr:nucleoporin NUP2 [Geosmithia morbida]KAF4125662.1 nucleoporin NUP2 [Geosmithia morbida]
MVTFSIPGDDVAETTTPRSRPPLPFAKRAYPSSPYHTAPRRLGASQGASSRKTLTTRDDVPASSLGRSLGSSSNIFRASTVTDSPTVNSFSPSLPQTSIKRVFAPGATLEPTRVQRESIAQATPRGVAAREKEKDLFHMRIPSPPRELTGEVLAKKVPKEWDPKGSIYADQFLGHLCPPDLDDEQRRQFFCILDLRRLKYAADEIFCSKSWKLNVINFAKEFEKSRSIILLHYGLYEFQNVKPSKELIKRWRREHGLPPLDDDEPEASATPAAKTTSTKKKRKAADDGGQELQSAAAGQGKRRATERDDVADEPHVPAPASTPIPASASAPAFPAPAPTPVLGKNKRWQSEDEGADSQPNKIQKQPSSARSLFEKAANKASTTPTASPSKASGSLFTGGKPTSSDSLFQSVLKNNAKTDSAQAAAPGTASSGAGNIFGHLSGKTGSAADHDSDEENNEPPAKKAAPGSAVEASTPGDSMSGRSLFDRVSKPSDAAPSETPAAAPPKDQTWNPSTTPINVGAAAAPGAGSLFGQSSTPAATSASNLFGAAAPKGDKPAETEANGKTGTAADKDGSESDKENDSQGPNEAPLPAKPAPAFGSSSLFGLTKPTTEASKPATSATPSLFGKPAESSTAATPNPMQSSTLFGAKPSESEKTASAEPSKPPAMSLFGAQATTNGTGSASSLFGAKPAASTLFGNNSASTPSPASSLFGTNGAASQGAPAKPDTQSAPKPSLFGQQQPLSPPSNSAPAAGGSMFDGSPMKQDDKPQAAKSLFGAASSNGNNAPSATPSFSFGASTTPALNPPTSNLFGASVPKPPSSNGTGGAGSIFGGLTAGANTPAPAASSFNFSFGSAGGSNGGGSAGSSFSNPFASGDNKPTDASGSGSEGMFSFGSAPASQPGGTFQFGSNNVGNSTPTGNLFGGASQPSANGAGLFGGAGATPAAGSATPTFSFGGAPSQTTQNAAPVFNLQPPMGGPSTGSNTPSILGGSSSLATTPAHGSPEPPSTAAAATATTTTAKGGEEEEGEKHEQINLADKEEEGEDVLHEVRAKVLKFKPASDDDADKPKSKSPWSTQGVGALRILQNKETKMVRLLMRAEPRGNVAINRALIPDLVYKADEKYVKVATANETGDGMETWMVQVKTKEFAKALADSMEEHKSANKKD